MAFNVQATVADVVAAGYVRIGQLSEEMLYLLDNYQPAESVAYSIIDLRQKLEALAFTTEPRELNILLGDLGETYGIPESVYTDPVLHAMNNVPASGARLEPLVLRIQGGKVLRIQGGKLLGLGYKLVPNTPPVYNTILLPSQTVGSVAYGGLAGTVFAFAGPVPMVPGIGRFLRLYVGGVQVGRIDFPSTLDGEGFSLFYAGTTYYSTFQAVATNELTLF